MIRFGRGRRGTDFRKRRAESGFALGVALFVLLVFFAALGLLVGLWTADLEDLDRERAESHLTAASDAGVALARVRLVADPGFRGRLERRVGATVVRVDVRDDAGSWRRLRVEAHWRRFRRLTLVDLAPGSSGSVVVGWLPAALDPDG